MRIIYALALLAFGGCAVLGCGGGPSGTARLKQAFPERAASILQGTLPSHLKAQFPTEARPISS